MSVPWVDTDVIIRLVTGDDPAKQPAARALLRAVEDGQLTVAAPYTVIADAVFVLASPRTWHRSCSCRTSWWRTSGSASRVEPDGSVTLDFGDALLVAAMEREGATDLYSFDRDFDRFPWLNRREP